MSQVYNVTEIYRLHNTMYTGNSFFAMTWICNGQVPIFSFEVSLHYCPTFQQIIDMEMPPSAAEQCGKVNYGLVHTSSITDKPYSAILFCTGADSPVWLHYIQHKMRTAAGTRGNFLLNSDSSAAASMDLLKANPFQWHNSKQTKAATLSGEWGLDPS